MPMMYPAMYPGMFLAAGMPHPQQMMAPPPSQQHMMMGAEDESDEGTEAGLPAGIPTPQQNPSGLEFQHQLAAPPLSSLPQPEVPSVPMEDGHQRFANSQISRSYTYVKNIPRNRISEVMEEVDPSLDPAFSSELSTDGLLTVMWLYCRVKPWLVEAWSCLVHELRGTSWNFGLRRVASSQYKKNVFQAFTLGLRFQAFAFRVNPSSAHSRKPSPTPWT